MKLTKPGLKYSIKSVQKTSSDKTVPVKLTRDDYIKLVEKAQEWPLSLRIAAELFRSGVTLEEFENEIHLRDNPFSNRVYEVFVNFHLNKGWNPAIVAPVRPVYLRYKSKSATLEENPPKGRPTREQALEFVKKLVKQKEDLGWTEADLLNSFRDYEASLDTDGPIRVTLEGEFEEEVKKEESPQLYHVLIHGKWEVVKTAAAALRLQQSVEKIAKQKVLSEKEQKSSKICCHCGYLLEGLLRVSISDESVESGIRFMHMGCYWMKEVPAAGIVKGFQIFSAADACSFEWMGMPDGKGNGGWGKITLPGALAVPIKPQV